MMNRTETAQSTSMGPALQKVVVVSKYPQMTDVLETVLDAGQYDVVFVESTEHAYSQIKRVAPDLVIVCLEIDDLAGFQVLSMLKLDGETRRIPIVTCAAGGEVEEPSEDAPEPEEGVFMQRPAVSMN